MPKHHTYRRPPIEEAVCELRFTRSPDWNLTVPGLFYERIRDSYPGQPRERLNVQMGGLMLDPPQGRRSSQTASPPQLAFTHNDMRVQFSNKNNKRQISIGRDILSVHDLRPYSGWQKFRPRISQALQAYREVVSLSGIRRIGLRYINLISVASTSVELDEYFIPMIGAPSNIPIDMTAFLARIESIYSDHHAKLLLTFGSAKAIPGHTGFALDLDVVAEFDDDPLPLDSAMHTIDDLHEREHHAFESLITDRTREVFDAR